MAGRVKLLVGPEGRELGHRHLLPEVLGRHWRQQSGGGEKLLAGLPNNFRNYSFLSFSTINRAAS